MYVMKVKDSVVGNVNTVRVEFNPTVPHCSLATLIGLCIRVKLERCMPYKIKLDIFIKKGAHTTENESNYFVAIAISSIFQVFSLCYSKQTNQ